MCNFLQLAFRVVVIYADVCVTLAKIVMIYTDVSVNYVEKCFIALDPGLVENMLVSFRRLSVL
jgi:hypothetical protein